MTSPTKLNALDYAENPARERLERHVREPLEALSAEREGEREA